MGDNVSLESRIKRFQVFFPAIRRITETETPDPNLFLEELCHALGMIYTPADLRGHARPNALSRMRQAGYFGLYRCKLGLSLEEVGRFFGDRDHATVLYGCKLVEPAYDAWLANGSNGTGHLK